MERQSSYENVSAFIGVENFNFDKKEDAHSDTKACRICGAIYSHGAWRWNEKKENGFLLILCSACQKIHDKTPGAYVSLQGKYTRVHNEEIIGCIRNIEIDEKIKQPMQRIMSIDKRAEKLMISTTESQLARKIGKELQIKYQGHLEFSFHQDETILRVLWQR